MKLFLNDTTHWNSVEFVFLMATHDVISSTFTRSDHVTFPPSNSNLRLALSILIRSSLQFMCVIYNPCLNMCVMLILFKSNRHLSFLHNSFGFIALTTLSQ
eukprot:c4615_g1_i1.p1 GENE.c4615_g1_i1~~c4615_g1_i1.p1  ORF type:complete len:101 (-),score=6.73 c4615_g1_i1:185-487(-)